MTDKMNISDEFTYKDSQNSFGDLLNDKRQYQFSWIKTLSVLCVLVGSIFFLLVFLFTTGKNKLIEKQVNASSKLTPAALKTSSQSDKMNQQLAMAIKQSAQEHVKPEKQIDSSIQVNISKDTKSFTSNINNLETIESVDQITKQIQAEVAKEINQIEAVNQSNNKLKFKNNQKNETLSYKVIAGTFADKKNAKALQKSLSLKKISSFIWTSGKNNKPLYKVQVGAFPSKKEAEKFRLKISRKGFQSYIFFKS